MRHFGLRAVRKVVPADQMDGIEDIAKVIALSGVDNINNFAGVKRIHAVMYRGEIGCGIQKSAVGFANKKRAFAI